MAVECCAPKTVHVILAIKGGIKGGGKREVSRETETDRDTTWREKKTERTN